MVPWSIQTRAAHSNVVKPDLGYTILTCTSHNVQEKLMSVHSICLRRRLGIREPIAAFSAFSSAVRS